MLEIVALVMLSQTIARMARRRGRSPTPFVLMLVGLWSGGEIAGAFLYGFVLGAAGYRGGLMNVLVLVVYAVALVGAAVGATCAFAIARCVSPVDGVFLEFPEPRVRRPRLTGILVGGIAGGAMGAAVTAHLYRGEGDIIPIVVQGFLALGAVGAALGAFSGLEKKEVNPPLN
jgi:hypothetical protein